MTMRGETQHRGNARSGGRTRQNAWQRWALLACFGWFGTAVIAGCTGDTVEPVAGEISAKEIGKIPEISSTGPHPKAVIEEVTYHFGTMEHGSEGEHAFVIRNEGEAALELYSSPKESSCQCTIGKVGNTVLAPGESTEITLSWTIKSPAPKFSHFAKVRTNDPENPTVDLRVEGFVGQHIAVRPHGNWSMGRVESEDQAVITGTLHSETVDEFKILKIESSDPHMTAQWRVLDPGEVADLRQVNESDMEAMTGTPEEIEKAKQDALDNTPPPTYGYELTARLDNEIALGAFKINLAVHTDVERAPITNITVTGTRVGAIELLPIGRHTWSPTTMRLRLDEFPAKQGKKVTLMMFVSVPDDLDFKILDLVSDTEWLVGTYEKDEKFPGKGRERHFIKMEIPPGSPPHSRLRSSGGSHGPAKVTIKTNHPEAEEIRFEIEYLSTGPR